LNSNCYSEIRPFSWSFSSQSAKRYPSWEANPPNTLHKEHRSTTNSIEACQVNQIKQINQINQYSNKTNQIN